MNLHGAIWLFREAINFLKSKTRISINEIVNKFKENKLAMAFLIFIVAIICGEVFMAISGIDIDYINSNGEAQVLRFNRSNITMGIKTIFIFITMIALSFKIKTKEEVKELLKVFCISTIFAIIWGLIQFVIYYLNIEYPAFLFNNNPYATQWYGEVYNKVKRISSIALEPSTFAVNLICFLPFLIGEVLKSNKATKGKKYILAVLLLILTTACAILTTSTTAYVGLVVVYALFGIYMIFFKNKDGEFYGEKHRFTKLILSFIIPLLFAVVVCFVSVVIGYKTGIIKDEIETMAETQMVEKENKPIFESMLKTIRQMTINKLSTGSGKDRMEAERIGLSLIKYSPVFGFGFVSYRTFSLFTNILLNAGIFGVISFLYILYVVIKELIKLRKKEETISIMFLISIIGSSVCFFARST